MKIEGNVSGQTFILKDFTDNHISGLNGTGSSFMASDFSGLKIERSNFSLSDLGGSNMAGCEVKECNMSFIKTNAVNASGSVFENVNFSQLFPHTKIFDGSINLTFIGCNLTNCDVPFGSEVVDCLQCHKSFCANLHPDWPLPKEAEVCVHITNPNTVIDKLKELVGINTGAWEYEDKIVP